ncbi:MAG: 2-phosphoglycolate phosphatase [Halieaceae bacterium]|jgi:2-phosphoglycolate phosphatase
MKHPGKNLRAVIFDLDGTLIDTADDFVPAVQQLRAENHRPPMDEARIRRSVSNGSRALVHLALDLSEEAPAFESQRQRLLVLYSDLLGHYAQPYPGIRELLAELHARGIAWGIATNKPRIYTLPLLDTLDLRPAAQSVVCPEDVSQTKPHPECLQIACRELRCAPSEAIYVGDHVRDIEAGRRAAMHTVAAAYGYIESDDDPAAWGADARAATSADLHNLLLSDELQEIYDD